jgi:Mg2+ and Co2+ transporter CorA
MDGREEVRKWFATIKEEIKDQNKEITRIANRVGDDERLRIAERVSIDKDIADGLKNIVSNIDRLERMIDITNQRLERLADSGVHYPYV